MKDLSLEELLEPLFSAMETYRLSRIVARPGAVTGDGLGGMGTLDMEWDEGTHQELLSVVDEPVFLDDGAVIEQVGGQIVIRLAPSPEANLPGLMESGMLSEMAASVVSVALGLGRNVVLTGPAHGTVPLCVALLAEGERPAVMGLSGMVPPQEWPHLSDLGEVQVLGPDRLGVWCCPAESLVEIMSAASGVVGCVDGGRRDRALTRMENALSGVGMPDASRGLAGAVDLVVTVAWRDGFRCTEISECVPTGQGVRSHVLFEAGHAEAGGALVPVGRPSFLGELASLGMDGLAEAIVQATVQAPARAEDSSSITFSPSVPTEPSAPRLEAPVAAQSPRVDVDLSRTMPRPPNYSPDSVADASDTPGWELDRAEQSGVVASESRAERTPSADDAIMAAAYGLEPPPRPSGVKAVDNPNFQQALEEARLRDQTFRELQDATSPTTEE
jgi:hypothetical protein